MSILTYVMAAFMLLAAADRILGNRFGLGREFESGIELLGTMALSMVGMIVAAPLIAHLMQPLFDLLPSWIDPSILPSVVFANDMGGAPLAVGAARHADIGAFNAMVVSSMMGCTVSFTIPFCLGCVPKALHRDMLLGLLCGIVTIPLGCFVGGLVSGIAVLALLVNLLPLLLFSAVVAFGILRAPDLCVKIFSVLGWIIKAIITVGLAVGLFEFLTGVRLLPHVDTLESGVDIVLNACAVMTGTFPMIYLLSKLLAKPLKAVGSRIGINESAALGFVSSLATSVTTFSMMEKMDRRGIILNAAFLVSAGFVFTDHMAFTMAYMPDYLPAMITGKLTAAVLALLLAIPVCKKVCSVSAPTTEPREEPQHDQSDS
ncbi:MAG: ethanolamine utilization protein EutH [Clostridia bacterium]|nr:ethanolamine utilization protein EutH [Clostridia bacterium]